MSREAGQTVLWFYGEHDIATGGVAAGALAEAIADDADVIVDLSETEFLGAATIHLLMRTRALLRRQGRSMTVRSPSKCARRVLSLCDASLGGEGVLRDNRAQPASRSTAPALTSPMMGDSARSGS